MPHFIKTGFWALEQKGYKGWLNLENIIGSQGGGITTLQKLKEFKPGSIGKKVSFKKVSGTDPATNKDVIIPGELEITRANSGNGIYNIAVESNFNSSVSPENTFWNTQYVTAENTSWAPLWDVRNRSYINWRDAIEIPSGNPAPSQYVGMPAIMMWDDGDSIVRYWLIMFTEWGVGNYNEYGFAYDRYEILPAVEFTQPSSSNINTPQVIDIISEGVHITRSYEGGGIYNIVNEPNFNGGVSPRNTKWNSSFNDLRSGYSGYDDLSNLESRVYTDFANALDYNIGDNVLDTDLIMYDMTTDLYYEVQFSEWASGCESGIGAVFGYDTLDEGGSGYPNGTTILNGIGGSGINITMRIIVSGGIIINPNLQDEGQNYQVGDVITFPYSGVTEPIIIEVTEVCSMGGFAYRRTVIPQSNGIKFADGTVINTALTSSATPLSGEVITVQNFTSLFSSSIDAGVGATTAYQSNFFGEQAGYGATSASNSNFFGPQAGYLATDAQTSNFLGASAGNGATSAIGSNFFGANAGYGATNASGSNFLGINAGYQATEANNSNFIGASAGYQAVNAYQSNFFGQSAGIQATSASNSNFFGFRAGIQASGANNSNFFGPQAGYEATNAANSNFLGNNAGYQATNANDSNFFGLNAGFGATNASYSNFIGSNAGYNATNAYLSNFFGLNAGISATSANYSNFIGANAGNAADSASYSNFIGQQAGSDATSASNSNFLGFAAGAYATNATQSNFLGNQAGAYAINASDSNFMGHFAGNGATGANNSNFIGQQAGKNATGANNSNFIGNQAGINSTGNYVNAFGTSAGEGNALNGQTIFSNSSLPSYANRAAAVAAITVLLGASAGDTYLYYNETTFGIEAVRL